VIVAVGAVRVVQVAVHQIVGVMTVRNRFVSASRAVAVTAIVALALVRRRALLWIGSIDADAALIYVIAVDVMHVTIVQVIVVIAVLDGPMSTTWLMYVCMPGVRLMVAHDSSLRLVSKSFPSPVLRQRDALL
jgi:hypothetical protein